MTTATKSRTSVKPTTRNATVQTIGTTRVLWLTNGKLTLAYRLESIPSDLGGIAFQLSKAHQGGDEQPEVYHVLLDGQNTSCTCAGHSYRGKCKHVDGLEALLKAGKIAAPAAKPNPPRNNPPSKSRKRAGSRAATVPLSMAAIASCTTASNPHTTGERIAPLSPNGGTTP